MKPLLLLRCIAVDSFRYSFEDDASRLAPSFQRSPENYDPLQDVRDLAAFLDSKVGSTNNLDYVRSDATAIAGQVYPMQLATIVTRTITTTPTITQTASLLLCNPSNPCPGTTICPVIPSNVVCPPQPNPTTDCPTGQVQCPTPSIGCNPSQVTLCPTAVGCKMDTTDGSCSDTTDGTCIQTSDGSCSQTSSGCANTTDGSCLDTSDGSCTNTSSGCATIDGSCVDTADSSCSITAVGCNGGYYG